MPRCCLATLLQCSADLGACGGPGWGDSEKNSGHDGHACGKDEDSPVEWDAQISLLPCVREEFGECGAAHISEDQPDRTAHCGDHQALGEHLAENPPAACSESETHAHLALSHRCTGKHEVRDVGAGEEKYEADEGEQHVERFGKLPAGVVQSPAAVLEDESRHGVVFFDCHRATHGCA